MKKIEKIILFINGDRGLILLKHLSSLGFDIRVYCADQLQENLQHFEIHNHVKISYITSVNEEGFLKELESYSPDLIVVAGFPYIFEKRVLDVPVYGAINLHAGPLPKYRGGSPLNWQIINGEEHIGISVIKAVPEIDRGPILASKFFDAEIDMDIATAHARANKYFPYLVIEAIEKLERGEYGVQQNEDLAIYWHQRSDVDGGIDFSKMTALEAHRKVKALTSPYSGAWANYQNSKIRILSSCIPDEVIRGEPGRICWIQKRGPYVVCKDKAILIFEARDLNLDIVILKHGKYLNL